MNWGMKIVIGMALAMSSIVATGIYMVSKDTDTLEEADYYEKGLNYEQAYEKKENVVRYQRRVSLDISGDSLLISFAETNNQGLIEFLRPSNKSLDQQISFSTSQSSYTIPLNKLERGVWHIKLNWESNKRSYFQEENLYLN